MPTHGVRVRISDREMATGFVACGRTDLLGSGLIRDFPTLIHYRDFCFYAWENTALPPAPLCFLAVGAPPALQSGTAPADVRLSETAAIPKAA